MRNNIAPVPRGLTLVELLVAISILGLVAVIGWRGLDGIVRARGALTAELEQTRGMQLAFAQLQSDCAQLANASTLSNRPPLQTLANQLTLVRTVYADDQPSKLQVISYRVQNGNLTRRASSATRDLNLLDQLWLAAVNDTDTTPAVLLQTGVTAMSLRIWLGGSWQPGMDAATMASMGNGLNPTGLEVVLKRPNSDNGLIKLFLLGAV